MSNIAFSCLGASVGQHIVMETLYVFFIMEVNSNSEKITNPITSKTHYLYHHEGDVEDTCKNCGEATLRL